jgi:hypothetical protein
MWHLRGRRFAALLDVRLARFAELIDGPARKFTALPDIRHTSVAEWPGCGSL